MPAGFGQSRDIGRGADNRQLPPSRFGNRAARHRNGKQGAVRHFRRGLQYGVMIAAKRHQCLALSQPILDPRGIMLTGCEQRALAPTQADDAEFGQLAIFDQSGAYFARPCIPQQAGCHGTG
jgi:hypothetical protein